MQQRDAQRIEHILNYCLDIETAIARFGQSYEEFVSDKDFHTLLLSAFFRSVNWQAVFPTSFAVKQTWK